MYSQLLINEQFVVRAKQLPWKLNEYAPNGSARRCTHKHLITASREECVCLLKTNFFPKSSALTAHRPHDHLMEHHCTFNCADTPVPGWEISCTLVWGIQPQTEAVATYAYYTPHNALSGRRAYISIAFAIWIISVKDNFQCWLICVQHNTLAMRAPWHFQIPPRSPLTTSWLTPNNTPHQRKFTNSCSIFCVHNMYHFTDWWFVTKVRDSSLENALLNTHEVPPLSVCRHVDVIGLTKYRGLWIKSVPNRRPYRSLGRERGAWVEFHCHPPSIKPLARCKLAWRESSVSQITVHRCKQNMVYTAKDSSRVDWNVVKMRRKIGWL